MAAPSKAEVEELIRVAVTSAFADVDRQSGYLIGEQLFRAEAETALSFVVNETRQELSDANARIDVLCTGYNAKFEQHRVVIQGIVDGFKETTAGLTESVNEARRETKIHDERNTELRDQLGVEFGQQTATIARVRDEMSKWASDYKVDIMKLLQLGGGGLAASTGLPQSANGRTPTIDKK